MTEPYLGQIGIVGFNFPPQGWASCNGATLAIQQNTALFALLGVSYGGDGQTTFQLPNLCGRVPIGQGQGPGLTPRVVGDTAGAASVTLTAQELPAHAHELLARSTPGDRANARGASLAASADAVYSTGAPIGTLSALSLSPNANGTSPHPNMQPYLGMNFVIALQGSVPQFS